jgi:hypothetical protein
MLKALLLSLTTPALAAIATAQNLVPNPSFEEPTSCVGVPWEYGLQLATPWFSPNTATPDLYTVTAGTDCGTYLFPGDPDNLYREPYQGDRFAGFYAYNEGDSVKDYCSVPLPGELMAGRRYRVGFHYRVYSVFRYAVEELGILFTQAPVQLSHFGPIRLTPQVTVQGAPYLDSVDDWVRVQGEFVAEGGEQLLTIGSFVPSEAILPLQVSSAGFTSAYYLIDAVELVDITDDVGISELHFSVDTRWGNLVLRWDLAATLTTWRMTDAQGRYVAEFSGQVFGGTTTLPVPAASGVYIIEGVIDERRFVTRFVKE